MPASPESRSQDPILAASQLSSGGTSQIERSVNLFTGDVVQSLNLVRLPSKEGMSIDLTLSYQSNVAKMVGAWNRDAPTGVLGVGWTLGLERIERTRHDTAATDQDQFLLYTQGAAVALLRTGRSSDDQGNAVVTFALRGEPLWQVRYYPNEQAPRQGRWEVTHENGLVFVYGEEATALGCQWSNWIGPSAAIGASHYAGAWYLKEVRNLWGRRVGYAYEMHDVALGPDPSQTYTRAVHLASITAPDGRRIELQYADKAPCEVQLPHVSPDGQENAYQFSYASKYLARVIAKGADGKVHLTTNLDYALANNSPTPEQDDYRKRYLTGVRQIHADGAALPGCSFEYAGASDPNPGALSAMQYPNGAKAEYGYAAQPISAGGRRRAIPAPGGGLVPRILHGPSYVTLAWFDQASASVQLAAYSWNGAWHSAPHIDEIDAVAIDKLDIATAERFFAVHFEDQQAQRERLWIYRADPYRSGEWSSAYKFDPGAEASRIAYALGNDFVAAHAPGTGTLNLIQWNAGEARWEIQPQYPSFGAYPDHVALAAVDNRLLAFYASTSRPDEVQVYLYYRDENGQWQRGDARTFSTTVDWSLTKAQDVWSLAPAFASLTLVSAVENGTADYLHYILRWDTHYQFIETREERGSQAQTIDNPVAVSAATTTLVGHAQKAYRFDGVQWSSETLTGVQPGYAYAYAYGDDLAVVASLAQGSATVTYSAKTFDPYVQAWMDTGPDGYEGAEEIIPRASAAGSVCSAPRHSSRAATNDGRDPTHCPTHRTRYRSGTGRRAT